jgi:hypothetical protein
MTLAQLEIWYKGCTEYYLTIKETLVDEVKAVTVQPAIPVATPAIPIVETKSYLNVIKSINLIEEFNWGSRPMNSYLVTFENFNGNFIINCATAAEQKQPVAGSVISHQLKGTKIVKYKFIKI